MVENGSVGGYSWHIGAAQRPLTSLRLLLSPSPLAPSSSVSSFNSSFLSNTPGPLFLHHNPRHVSSLPRVSALRANTHTQRNTCIHVRAGVDPSIDSFHFVSARLVSTPPACFPSLTGIPRPLDASLLLPAQLSRVVSSSNNVQVCYDLHSSRNKTSATAPADDDKTKPCTKCITTSHVPAAKGHVLTSRFFLTFSFCLFSLFLPNSTSTIVLLFFLSDRSTHIRISSLLFLLHAIILATPVDIHQIVAYL